jgi:hypothetical protein
VAPGVALAAGLATAAAGLAAMHGLSADGSWATLAPGLLLTGIAIGIANPTIARVALGVVPPQRAGMASGASNTFRIGGLATGVAALGAVFQHELRASHGAVLASSHQAYVSGVDQILLVGTVLLVVGALAAVTLIPACALERSLNRVQVGFRCAQPVETASA